MPTRRLLLSDGHVDGKNQICRVHGWHYRYDTGISEDDNSEQLTTFTAWIDEADDAVSVDAEIRARTVSRPIVSDTQPLCSDA